MLGAVEAVDDGKAGAALAHPLRLAIMWALEAGPASPAELARRIEARVESVSYHVRKLHELGFIEADEPEHLEGTVRHRYRLERLPVLTEEAWRDMPVQARRDLTAAVVQRMQHHITQAIDEGGFDRADAVLFRSSLILDAEGFAEASRLLQDAAWKLQDVERRAKERLARPGSRRVDGYVATMLHEAHGEDPTDEMLRQLHRAPERSGRVNRPAETDGAG